MSGTIFRGRIVNGEEVLIPEVWGYLQTERNDWQGTFQFSGDPKIEDGLACSLVLSDGRQGEIIIEEVTISSDEEGLAVFGGDGPPPRGQGSLSCFSN